MRISMPGRRIAPLLIAALVGAAALVACGGESDVTSSPSEESDAAPSTTDVTQQRSVVGEGAEARPAGDAKTGLLAPGAAPR